jgi:Zn-dependent M28 family amino/carboxypeptidase
MHGIQKIRLVCAALAAAIVLQAGEAPKFSGARALEQTRKAVSFGPRPPGSQPIRQLQSYINAQIGKLGGKVLSYSFEAATPQGSKRMTNLIALFPGKSRRAIVFSGHYDTKFFPRINFVGANDGGSSTGFLLEMAHVVASMDRTKDVYFVWFDGEEAFGEWSDEDSLYGSRNLAEKWSADGTLGRVDALINVDMIGDKNLNILQDHGSSATLRRLIWSTAQGLGYGSYFTSASTVVGDDHVPFIRKGVNAVDVIDLDYTPWHTEGDTLDKLSANSFQVVGDVLVEVLQRLK